MTVQFQILLSRFLTRFGDQAWDFAVPLVLIGLFPGKLQIVAIYFLSIKIVQFFLTPSIMNTIDLWTRKKIFKLGIGSQTISLILSWVVIVFFSDTLKEQSAQSWIFLGILIILGIFSSIGSSLMEVSVGFDLAVDYLKKEELPVFNSRLKRLDLMTEVSAPLIAGLLLFVSFFNFNYFGFSLIALINLISFLPEYKLLSSVTHKNPESIKIAVQIKERQNPLREFMNGLKYFKDQRFAIPMIAYSFLWLSVLSPHGVLLAGYLKDSAHLSETEIGIFRGCGALFGLLPTFLYNKYHLKWGLKMTANRFLGFQLLCVTSAAVCFSLNSLLGLYLFMALVLFSRIGLYGFSIAEAEARQKFIPPELRGRINGFGVSLTSFATLFLFGLGSIMPSSADFKYLVYLSAGFVLVGFITLRKWKIST